VLRRSFLRFLLSALVAGCTKPVRRIGSGAPQEGCHRIVVLSDAHYARGTTPEAQAQAARKLAAVQDVNSWGDVELVALPGDIVARHGTRQEYEEALEFVSAIRKPKALTAGNHEYVYADPGSGPGGANGEFNHASPELQREKLDRFRKTFNQPDLFYARELGGYLLVFLSADVIGGGYLTEISREQLDWLKATLAANRARPTLVFFHAPLKGTLETYSPKINGPQRVAQPVEAFQAILAANPQVALWVSGHTHTPATNPSYAAPVNLYEGRVWDIHNADLGRETIWSNSIYLCPGKIVVKTWDHKAGGWLDGLERVIDVKS
jgi:3',5'-cyclic AMP phosphodiesterase CpdA